ncbi:hypothetical protein FKM82_020339 [Ascaphus truei]
MLCNMLVCSRINCNSPLFKMDRHHLYEEQKELHSGGLVKIRNINKGINVFVHPRTFVKIQNEDSAALYTQSQGLQSNYMVPKTVPGC